MTIEQQCGLESERKNKNRRTQRNVNKAEKVPEHIKFANSGGPSLYIQYSLAKFKKSIAIIKDLRAVFLAVSLPEVPSIKYSFQNTSSQQYFMLLTS